MAERDPEPKPRPRFLRASHSIYAQQHPGLKRYWKFAVEVIHKSLTDDLPLLAAAMAHYALLSVIPLLLFTASIFGVYLRSERAQEQSIELLAQYVPGLRTTEPAVPGAAPTPASRDVQFITRTFERLVRDRGSVGGIGLVVLLWICLRMFTTLQRALDSVWGIEHAQKRPFYLQYPISFVTILLMGAFAYISLTITALVGTLRYSGSLRAVETQLGLPEISSLATLAVSTLLSVLLMFLIFRLLPSARVRSRSAVYGALVAGVLWEAAKHLFTWFLNRYAHYDHLYGVMGGVVVVMLWSYISAYIVLIGAEVVFCHAKWIDAVPVVVDAAALPAEPEPNGAGAPAGDAATAAAAATVASEPPG